MDDIQMNQLYMVASYITKKPYIGSNNEVYLFADKVEGLEYIEKKKLKKAYLENKKTYRLGNLCNEMYFIGAKKIVYKLKEEKEVSFRIDTADLKKDYYNNESNGLILRLQETNAKKYLVSLFSSTFLVPIKIDPRHKTEYPKQHYCTALIKDEPYYILFTTLKEFEEWQKSQDNVYKPLEITIAKMARIRQHKGLFINPLSDKLLLYDSDIQIGMKVNS